MENDLTQDWRDETAEHNVSRFNLRNNATVCKNIVAFEVCK